MISPYLVHILIMLGIYIILALSLNLALGYTGLLNLGHIAFYGIGAYTSALLTQAGVPFFIAFFAAGTTASVFGFLLVKATNKLKGDYLALATLGFSFIVTSVLLNWISLTGGPMGIPGIGKPSIFNLIIDSNNAFLLFVAIITLLTILIIHRLVHSPFGRLLQATRDDELGLRVLGKDTGTLKAKAMTISAFFAGLAGSLFAHYISYIDPSSFTLTEIILVLTIVIVGGIASLRGSILASIFIISIPELLRFISIPSAILGPTRQIIYGLILLAILLWKPRGLFGKVDVA
jgi:branched-chain amino acid transport system permease protein